MLEFFKSPNLNLQKNLKFNEKVKIFYKTIGMTFLLSFVGVVVIKLVDSIISVFTQFSVLEAISKHNRVYSFRGQNYWFDCFYIFCLGPFIEEIIFRLPLNLKKWNVAISIAMIGFFFIGEKIFDMNLCHFQTWKKIIATILILVAFYFIKQEHLNLIKKKFGLYFYLLVCSFTLIHVYNFYHIIPTNLLVLAPLFVLPQFSLSLFTSYIRLSNGFFWGFLLHCCNNLPVVLFYVLTKK